MVAAAPCRYRPRHRCSRCQCCGCRPRGLGSVPLVSRAARLPLLIKRGTILLARSPTARPKAPADVPPAYDDCVGMGLHRPRSRGYSDWRWVCRPGMWCLSHERAWTEETACTAGAEATVHVASLPDLNKSAGTEGRLNGQPIR